MQIPKATFKFHNKLKLFQWDQANEYFISYRKPKISQCPAPTVVWPRKSKTSQTDKYLWETTFSHYLGQMNYRNANIYIYI